MAPAPRPDAAPRFLPPARPAEAVRGRRLPSPPRSPSPTWPRPAARGRSAHRHPTPPPHAARAPCPPCPPSPHPPSGRAAPRARVRRGAHHRPVRGGAGGARKEERAVPSPQKERGGARPTASWRYRGGRKERGKKRSAAQPPQAQRPAGCGKGCAMASRRRWMPRLHPPLAAPPSVPPTDEGGGGAASPLSAPGSYHGVGGAAAAASLGCWARRGLRQQEGKRRGREPSGNAADVTAAVPGGGSGCYGGTLRGNAPARSPFQTRACAHPQTPPTHRPHRGERSLLSLARVGGVGCPIGGRAAG